MRKIFLGIAVWGGGVYGNVLEVETCSCAASDGPRRLSHVNFFLMALRLRLRAFPRQLTTSEEDKDSTRQVKSTK